MQGARTKRARPHSLSLFNFGSQASKWRSVLQGKSEGRKGEGRGGEGRQRRNIWKKSSLTVQLFANSLHILQLHGSPASISTNLRLCGWGGSEGRKSGGEERDLVVAEGRRKMATEELTPP